MNNSFSKYVIYSIGIISARKLISKEKNKIQNNLNIPSFKDVLEVRHAISGRLRFYIPTLKNDLQLCYIIKMQLQKIESIISIDINPITASVTIKYSESQIKPTLIQGILIKLLKLEEKVNKEPKALVTKETSKISESLNLAVYEKTKGILDIKSLIFLVLIFSGINKTIKDPENKPSGTNMFWWAYSMMMLK